MATKKELPAKESAIFKNILKHYEHKQYKKGIKLADQILKKVPEHGETLAMKGLFLNNLDKKEEAYEHVKKGLRYDLTSHICWHVYGLIYRSDKNYEEAAKCYTHALKYNKNDVQILRDFAVLQTQMRHYEALNETRHQLLQLKSTNAAFWIGLAMSYHLLGKYDMAINVLTSHEEAMQVSGGINFEHSELLLYHNSLYEESKEYEKQLDHLDKIEKQVCDKRGWKEARARCLTNLGRMEDAETAYAELVDQNPDCYQYLQEYAKAKGLTSGESDESAFLEFYAKRAEQYPRANAVKRLPLNHATGETFRNLAAAYLQRALRKGVPSLFVSMKYLYQNPEKAQIIHELVTTFYDSLKARGTFEAGGDTSKPETPTTMLWTSYYLAQHYDHRRETKKALEFIDEAIAHTPTLVELHMTRGRVLKHAGDLEGALKSMNDARELDLQDRFINSKCAKYMLRTNKVEEAEKTIGLFTRHDAPSPWQDLVDMQCMWFALEEGEAFLRRNDLGKALKRYHVIAKTFDDIMDDQFDFHTYCLRKTTLRAYVSTLRWEDQLYSHNYYVRACNGAIKAYLDLYDRPKDDANGVNGAMSEAEKKKAKSKARKAALKAEKEAEAKKGQVKEEKKPQNETKRPVDEDPNGEKYLNTKDPLGDALKFLQPLLDFAPNRLETSLLGFEIYIRQKRMLLALKCLLHLSEQQPHHPNFLKNVVTFWKVFETEKDNINPVSRKVIEKHWKTVMPDDTVDQFLEQQIDAHKYSVKHLVKIAEAQAFLGKSEAGQELLKSKAKDTNLLSNVTLSDAQLLMSSISNVDGLKASFACKYPYAIPPRPRALGPAKRSLSVANDENNAPNAKSQLKSREALFGKSSLQPMRTAIAVPPRRSALGDVSNISAREPAVPLTEKAAYNSKIAQPVKPNTLKDTKSTTETGPPVAASKVARPTALEAKVESKQVPTRDYELVKEQRESQETKEAKEQAKPKKPTTKPVPILKTHVANGAFQEEEIQSQRAKKARTSWWPDLDAADYNDPTMASEYVEDIFDYLRELETVTMANPNYMAKQKYLAWKMRGVLVDWLIEVHSRFRMLPETLFLAVNLIDRFLSQRICTLHNFQLVGLACLFIAAKYEEIASPCIKDFLKMADGGYQEKDVRIAERYILQTLEFQLCYPNAMNFLRRISKADDYDTETRTIAKYLMEISLVDHRFLQYPPSQLAAAAMYLARLMLGRGRWHSSLVHYSRYSEDQLTHVVDMLVDYIAKPVRHESFFRKYAASKFLKA
ncbi:hypothetical protein BZG36_04404, partial [Bifiguratus adelaidae]